MRHVWHRWRRSRREELLLSVTVCYSVAQVEALEEASYEMGEAVVEEGCDAAGLFIVADGAATRYALDAHTRCTTHRSSTSRIAILCRPHAQVRQARRRRAAGSGRGLLRARAAARVAERLHRLIRSLAAQVWWEMVLSLTLTLTRALT